MLWCIVLLFVSGACASTNVTVVQIQLQFDMDFELELNSSVEYILEMQPFGQQLQVPARVTVSSDSDDVARPLLVTARQQTGAVTWQLPYRLGETALSDITRTLCPLHLPALVSGGEPCESANSRGLWSLHVSWAWCGAVRARVRVEAAADWSLSMHAHTQTSATPSAPAVHYFGWGGGAAADDSVRLVLHSPDDVCALVSVQNVSCPVLSTVEEVQRTGLRMTMARSAAAQLKHSSYPLGFYVVVTVLESERECWGEGGEGGEDWLWAGALGITRAGAASRDADRTKTISIEIKPALSRSQYAIGAFVTLMIFLLFYVGFGALVLAQRWPRFAKYVSPKAVLAKPVSNENGVHTETDAARRRRGSDATYDSSDISDEDENSNPPRAPAASPATPASPASPASPAPPAATNGANGTQTDGQMDARGLPGRLVVSALARRGGRVLRARSDRYLQTVYTVAVFYALPVLQFVASFQILLNVSGSLDICYYNFQCAHPAGALSDFNHVFSNLGYLLLGGLFLLQLRRRKALRRLQPRDEEYGIPAHYGLLSSLGAGLLVVALLSSAYHVCPNRLNFQFDTSFMYVLAVLSMVKIYQSRHPDVNARAHATFGVLAVIIALVTWGVLGGGALFWGLATVLHVFTFLLLSMRIYYVGQFRLEKESLARTARLVVSASRPRYMARLVMLLIANAVNWGFALYGLLVQTADFAGHMLNVLLCNTLLYMVFYLVMKHLHGERLRWYAWLYLAAAAAAWAPALYFFTYGSSSWSTTPAQSRHVNHECLALQFYDAHDLWHLLSAAALYLSFNAMLTWDDGLSAYKRSDIAVF